MMAADKQPVRPLGAIVREAVHSVAMECGPFTAVELAEFDKIAAGIKTTEQYRTEILAETEQENLKKRRNNLKTKRFRNERSVL